MSIKTKLFTFLATLHIGVTAQAQGIVFDDPNMASQNIDFINTEIKKTGKFIKPSRPVNEIDGRPQGNGEIYINKPIKCPAFCQIIGETDAHSPIVIAETFVGQEVIDTSPVEPPIEIRNVKFKFQQNAQASSRADLIPFPPFIRQLSGRAKFIDVTISGGIDGIIAGSYIDEATQNLSLSNAGGMYLERVKLGNFGTNLLIDGALDFVFLDTVEVWPFDFSNESIVENVWSDGETTAYHFKEVDGLSAGTLATFRARVIIESGNGSRTAGFKQPFGSIGNLQLDGRYASLVMKAGNISIGNSYSTSDALSADAVDDIAIDMQGGKLNIANFQVFGGISDGSPYGLITEFGGELQIGNLTSTVTNSHTNVRVSLVGDQVTKLHRTILQRDPSPSGYEFWVNALNSGVTVTSAARSFLGSAEATNLYGSDFESLERANKIDFMYKAILGRPDQTSTSEIALWDTYSIDQIITGLLASPEYQRR